MPLPTKMTDLSISAGSNYPAGSESRALADDYLRAIQTIIRLEQSQAASVASAATVDLGAIASGNYVHITGTTTITSLGTVSAGITRTVVFDGALTLTHNATSLILPGGASIVTAVGDAAKFVSEGGGNWRCINYERANISATNYAAAGANSDITSLSALPLAIATAGTTQASALTALGAALNGVLSKSAAYSVAVGDRGKLIDFSGLAAAVDATFPAVADGLTYAARNSDTTYAVTLKASATIDGVAGSTGIVLAPGESCLVVGSATAWKTVGLARSALHANGNAPMYACRAWVNFNGIGAVSIRASGNVSSITDNGVGDYTVNFLVNMDDVNYAVTASVGSATESEADDNRNFSPYVFAVDSVRGTVSYTDTNMDSLYVSIAVFR